MKKKRTVQDQGLVKMSLEFLMGIDPCEIEGPMSQQWIESLKYGVPSPYFENKGKTQTCSEPGEFLTSCDELFSTHADNGDYLNF